MTGLYACSTSTLKKGGNQDHCVTVKNDLANFIGVIIADGIGSHFKAELSSNFCANKLKEKLEQVKNTAEIDFEFFFSEIKNELIGFAKQSTDFDYEKLNKQEALGTTLLCALELENEFYISYSGNGSIWHTKGDFNKFSTNRYLPWNSINLLNPHCIEQEGKAALYRYVSISDASPNPTIIKLSKSQLSPGDIIIVTSDGVYSNDQVQIGKDDNEIIWIKSEESLPILYSFLSNFLKSDLTVAANSDLEATLNRYLENLKEKNYMHDDTTIGVIISQNAIGFHQQQYEQQ